MNRLPTMRIGVLADSPRTTRYAGDLLDALAALPGVRLAVLACPRIAPPRRPDARPAMATRTLAALLVRAEATALRLGGRLSGGIARRASGVRTGEVDLERWFDRTLRVDIGESSDPMPVDVDLWIALGRWVPGRGAAMLGDAPVLAIELEGVPASDAMLAGFDAADRGADTTSLRIATIGADGNGRRGAIDCANRTRPLFSLNQAACWGRAISLAIGCVESLRAGAGIVPADAGVEAPPAVASIGPARLLAYPFGVLGRGVRAALERARGRRRWSVALYPARADVPPAERVAHVPAAPPDAWYADPFLYTDPRTGIAHCFVEEFDERVGRGHLAVLAHAPDGWRRLGVVLKEPFHLSFPYVFEYRGELYMCPETGESGEIVVYRCDEFPLRWSRTHTLMRGVSAADTMLFERDGRWWMLTNIDRSPNPDQQTELHVFHADSPLSDDWRPVPGNPVKADCRGGRNGGLVIDGERLLRIGQVQSFEMYGKQLEVFRITRLDAGGYAEERVASIEPGPLADAAGTHTLGRSGDWIVVDLVGDRNEPGVSPVREAHWSYLHDAMKHASADGERIVDRLSGRTAARTASQAPEC